MLQPDLVLVIGADVVEHVGAGLAQRDLDVACAVGFDSQLVKRVGGHVPGDRHADLVAG